MTRPRRHPADRRATADLTSPVGWRRHAITLLVFSSVFVSLEVFSYTRESATWDEPVHVMDGYLSLAHGDFRTDIEHPPLLRMWNAVPLLALPVTDSATNTIDDASPVEWALQRLFVTAHRFMYIDNDADRLLYRARFMTVLLGIVLGVLVYAWTCMLFGWAPAAAVLVLYGLEPNIASHARLVTTDFGVTLAIFGAVFFLWRLTSKWDAWPLVGVTCCSALAVTAKYTGLLVAPILAVLLLLALWRRSLSWQHALIAIFTVGAASIGAIWASYGFSYAPGPSPNWQYAFHVEPAVLERSPTTARVVRWVDDHHLLPNGYSEGFLLSEARAGSRKAFLAGEYTEDGWWYYFPAAFLVKTPVVLIVLAPIGAWLLGRTRERDAPFVLMPPAVVMSAAMVANINIGVRHILPMYPFIVLLAGAAIARLFARGRTYAAIAVVTLASIEPLSVYPHTLAFFNLFAGGPSHGSEYLVDSNIDWGQDLKGLKVWMADHNVRHINLAYFGFADPRYYGIECTFLPGAPPWVAPELVQPPRLPGYVAVSATMLRGAYAEEPMQREFYARLARMRPVATIGYSIFIYSVDRPWYSDLR